MKIELNTKELRLIEAGLDSRNEHNKSVMNGAIYISKNAIKNCEKECCEIEAIKKKIQNAYKENVESETKETFELKMPNIPEEIKEDYEKMYKSFTNGFIGIDIAKNIGFSIPVIIYSKEENVNENK